MFVINFILNVFIPRLNEYNENLIAQLFIRVPLLPLRHFLKFSLSLLLSKENYLVELSLCTPAGCLTHPNLYPPFGEGKKKKKRKSRLQADKHLSNGVAVKAVTGDGVDVNPADREPGSPLGPIAEEKKKRKGRKKKKKERAAGNPVPLNFLLSHFHCRRPLDTPFVSFIFSSSYSFFSLSFSSFEQSTIFCIPVEIFILSFIYLGCTS